MLDEQGRATTSALLVVEDDPLVGHSFASLLREYARVELVTTLADADAALIGGRWAGIVLDVRLPDGSGLTWLSDLRARLDLTPVLVVSGLFDRAVVKRCHELDADCVFKPDVVDDLHLFGARAAARFELAHTRAQTTIDSFQESLQLTPRETDLVRLLARGERTQRLAASAGVSPNTAKTMVRRVLEKFEEPTVEAVARTIFEEILRGEPSAPRGRAR